LLKTLNYLDYTIIFVYLFAMIATGFFLARSNKNDQDFFKGGHKIPWPMASLSLFIGSFSAYMFVAAAGQAYKTGIASLLLYTSVVYPFVICAFSFAKLWRRTRLTSPMEYVEMRFGKITTRFITFVQIGILLLFSAVSLYVLCIFISSALKLTGTHNIAGFQISGLTLCVLAAGIIVLLYTTLGGLWAVIIADTIQFIIVMISASAIAVLSCIALAHTSQTFSAAVSDMVHNPPVPDYFRFINSQQALSFSLAWIALSIFSSPGNFQTIQRSVCVQDEKAAAKTNAVAAVFFLIAPIIWITPVIIMRKFLPDMTSLWPQLKNPAEASYVTVALMLLPNGMIGITVSAILAATISHLAASYNLLAALATRDIYKPFICPSASPQHLMWAGRISNLLFSALAIALSLVLAGNKDAFQTTFTVASHTVIAVAFPLAMGILIRPLPWWTAIVSIIACFSTTLSIEIFAPLLADRFTAGIFSHISSHLFEYKVFGAIIVNIIVFTIAAFLYDQNRNDAPQAARLFELLKTPVSSDPDAKLFIPNLQMYKLVGFGLLPFGIALLAMHLFSLSDDPGRINLIIGLVFIFTSACILWLVSPSFSPVSLVRQQQKDHVTKPAKASVVN
jgi:SSS family solute:Na+ symporter